MSDARELAELRLQARIGALEAEWAELSAEVDRLRADGRDVAARILAGSRLEPLVMALAETRAELAALVAGPTPDGWFFDVRPLRSLPGDAVGRSRTSTPG
jgi:hypothetical protein